MHHENWSSSRQRHERHNNVLSKTVLSKDDIDLNETNEAFSCVSLANNKLLSLDTALVNINGGAVALCHPVGASGARILTTLIYVMKNKNTKRGVASLCIGDCEATAVLVEQAGV